MRRRILVGSSLLSEDVTEETRKAKDVLVEAGLAQKKYGRTRAGDQLDTHVYIEAATLRGRAIPE